MAADFLDGLVFGDVSPEVENFLRVSVQFTLLKQFSALDPIF